MKVNELLARLLTLDPDIEVVMSKDSEGNNFSPCSSAEEAYYVPESTWSGEIHPCKKGGENCVVLYPIN